MGASGCDGAGYRVVLHERQLIERAARRPHTLRAPAPRHRRAHCSAGVLLVAPPPPAPLRSSVANAVRVAASGFAAARAFQSAGKSASYSARRAARCAAEVGSASSCLSARRIRPHPCSHGCHRHIGVALRCTCATAFYIFSIARRATFAARPSQRLHGNGARTASSSECEGGEPVPRKPSSRRAPVPDGGARTRYGSRRNCVCAPPSSARHHWPVSCVRRRRRGGRSRKQNRTRTTPHGEDATRGR